MVAGIPKPRRVIGHRLGVVAGRHGDDAAVALGLAERGQLVQRAAVLERIGDLQVLVFDVDLGAGQRRQPGRRQHGVRSTAPLMTRRAASMSAMVTVKRAVSGGLCAPCRMGDKAASRLSARPAPLAPGRFVRHLGGDGGARQSRARTRGASGHVDRHQTPRLRPDGEPRIVRGRAGAPGDRFRHRFRHHRHPGGAGRHVHFRLRHRHAGARLGALLAAAGRDGDLGAGLFRAHAGADRARPPSACG